MKRQPLKPVSKKRAAANREYAKVREVYLRENPECPVCRRFAAAEIHHICSGGNRASSLANSDTWIGLCGMCHVIMQAATTEMQVYTKLTATLRTINRLRGRAENAITLEDLR